MKNLEFRIKNEESKAGDCIAKFSILNSQFLISVVIFIFMTLTAGTGRAEGELRFRFKPGDKFFLTTTTEQKITQVRDGNENLMHKGLRIGSDLDIEEVDDEGQAWARYTYRRAFLKIQETGIEYEYDSEANKPRIPAPALPFKAVIGEGFYIRITPFGRITKINGLAGIVSAAKSQVPPNLSNRDGILADIELMYSENSIRRSLEEQLAVFPDANVVECNGGALSWENKDSIKSGGLTLFAEKKYQVREVLNGIAVLDFNLTTWSDPNAGQVERSGVQVSRQVLGQGQGRIEIEQVSGRIISQRLTHHVVESIETVAKGPVLRLPPVSEPIHTYIRKSFQMTRRE